MKLEAVDRCSDGGGASAAGPMRPATVARVMDGRVLIRLDGCGESRDYWVRPSAAPPHVRPAGWCAENGVGLLPPPAAVWAGRKAGEDRGSLVASLWKSPGRSCPFHFVFLWNLITFMALGNRRFMSPLFFLYEGSVTPPFLGRALETGRVVGNDFHFGLILPFQEESGQAEQHWVSHEC